jgi:AraC-like DNA-binding protein
MSPKQSILAERLEGAHRALCDASARLTVTGVATDFGFHELGRFAGIYRQAFGEAPSDTLRGAGRKRAVDEVARTRGRHDACTSQRIHSEHSSPAPGLECSADGRSI